MGFWLLIIVAFVCFGGLLLVRAVWGRNGVFVLGIGGVVGSNVYHIGDYPIIEGNFVWGIDSIIYTLFLVCVMVLAMDKHEKSAYVLMYSGIGSILFNAMLQFFASWGSSGIETGVIYGLISNALSAFATFLAVYLVLKLPKILKTKHWNDYFIMILCIVLASIINSLIYYGGIALVEGGFDANFGWTLLSSYLGKALALTFAIIMWAFSKLIDKKRNINNKEIEDAQT